METVDVVCKRKVEVTPLTPSTEYRCETLFFCTKVCQRQFESDPEQYMYKQGVAAKVLARLLNYF